MAIHEPRWSLSDVIAHIVRSLMFTVLRQSLISKHSVAVYTTSNKNLNELSMELNSLQADFKKCAQDKKAVPLRAESFGVGDFDMHYCLSITNKLVDDEAEEAQAEEEEEDSGKERRKARERLAVECPATVYYNKLHRKSKHSATTLSSSEKTSELPQPTISSSSSTIPSETVNTTSASNTIMPPPSLPPTPQEPPETTAALVATNSLRGVSSSGMFDDAGQRLPSRSSSRQRSPKTNNTEAGIMEAMQEGDEEEELDG